MQFFSRFLSIIPGVAQKNISEIR